MSLVSALFPALLLHLCLFMNDRTNTVALPTTKAYDQLMTEASDAHGKGLHGRAIEIYSKAIALDPKRYEAWSKRGVTYRLKGDSAGAITNFDKVLEIRPDLTTVWQMRGEEKFKLGEVSAAVADFDKYSLLVPSQKPQNWQRGIALFEADRFKEAKEQFELHQTVNPNDVENAVWHFLSNARLNSVDQARTQLIPINGDRRVPMSQIHSLFGGKATVEEVMEAAKVASSNEQLHEQLFFAYLYVGLYLEASKEIKQSVEMLSKATKEYKMENYMGDVARVHLQRMKPPAP